MRLTARATFGVATILLIIGSAPLLAQSVTTAVDSMPAKHRTPRWSIEVMGGSAFNLPTPLVVRQQGYPEIRLRARYATKPFGPLTPYYAVRLRAQIRQQPWELELVHHRLYLINTTKDISRFDVHFGYNYILLGRAWQLPGVLLHTAVGPILPNPDNIVRGRRMRWEKAGFFDVGGRLSGVGAGITVSREVKVASHAFLVVDGGAIFGQARIPVAKGSAYVPNVGLHAHLGLGIF